MKEYVNIETESARIESLQFFENLSDALNIAYENNTDLDHGHPLLVMLDDSVMWLQYLKSSHDFLFNFEGGGWNSSSGKSKEEAIKNAKEKIDKMELSKFTIIDENSFRLKTEEGEKQLMSNFY